MYRERTSRHSTKSKMNLIVLGCKVLRRNAIEKMDREVDNRLEALNCVPL